MPTNTERTLGQFLKTLRTQNTYSLRDVEQGTGISNAYMSLLENDKIKKPAPNNLRRLAEFYKVELAEMLTLAGILDATDAIPKPAAQYVFSKENLSEEEEAELMKYLQFIRTRK